MSKISDLREAREAACQRCEAAMREVYDAFTNLLGFDAAAATLSDAPVAFRIEGTPPSTRFVVDDMAEASSLYAPYAPPPWGRYNPANWHDDIRARRDAYIAAASQA